MSAPGIWPPAASPFPLTGLGYAGVYGTHRALDRWKYKRRPPRTQLSGAMTNVTNNAPITSAALFPQTGSYLIQIDNEMMFVVLGAGTTNWTVVRGLNGTAAVAHNANAVVNGKSWIDVVALGDSTVQCSIQGVDGWVERLRTALSIDVGGGGAYLGSGFYPLWRSGAQGSSLFGIPSVTNSATEWSFAGVWAQVGNGSAQDLMPYNGALLGISGATQIATFTLPTIVPIASADIFLTLTTVSGQGSYSVDGGGTWINIPGNVSVGSGVRMEYANVAIPATATTLKIRCANSAATGASINLNGVRLWGVTPTFGVTTGVVVHNLGYDGQVLIGNNLPVALDRANASGDNYALFNGQPASFNPDLLVLGPFSNDVGLTSDANIAAHIQNVLTRVGPYCDVVLVTCSEQDRRSLPSTLTTTAVSMGQQRNTNLAQRAQAILNNAIVLDMYEAFQAEGDNGFFASNTDGLMFDTLHWSALGCTDVASRVARILLGGY